MLVHQEPFEYLCISQGSFVIGKRNYELNSLLEMCACSTSPWMGL